MPVTFLPTTARVLQRWRHREFRTAATTVSMIAPSLECPAAPAACLPDDPDRICGYQADTTPEQERARVMGELTVHGATMVSHYRDVTIVDGTAYNSAGHMVVANRTRRRPVIWGAPVVIDRAMLCTNDVIDRYFGHWLVDGLLLELLAMQTGALPLTVSAHRWPHEAGYRGALALRDSRHPHVHVKELLVADDRGLNASWRARADILRRRLRGDGADRGTGGAPVFVRRGVTGARRALLNEDALATALERRGFVSLAPEQETPVAIAARLSRAPVIVLVEGSAQDHALLAAPRGAWIITIMPPRRMNSFAKVRADALGINWAFTVADDAADGTFHQPPERLFRLIDLVSGRREAVVG